MSSLTVYPFFYVTWGQIFNFMFLENKKDRHKAGLF